MNKPAWTIAIASILFSFGIPSRAVLSPEQLRQAVVKAQAGDTDARVSLQSELLYYQMLEGSPGMMTSEDAKSLKLIKTALGPAPAASAAPPAAAPLPMAPPAEAQVAAPESPKPPAPAWMEHSAAPPAAALAAEGSAAQTPEGLISQGEESLRQKRYDEARRQFEAAFAVLDLKDQRQVACLGQLGRLAVGRHDIAAARQLFSKAMKLADDLGFKKGPAVSEAYLGLGLCLIHDGERSQAVKMLKRGLKSAPGDETRGKLQRALEQAQRRQD
jgi:tetratricopeptide (TPR) repeat protein